MTELKASRFEETDGIATITMNRPEQMNPLAGELSADFGWLVNHIAKSPTIRALIITSDGDVFSAGGDVKMMAADQVSAYAVRSRIMDMHDWFERLLDLEIPVIAAVDGPVYGAGFSLALAADFILATPRARFCVVFNRIGLIPDMGLFHVLPRRIGLTRAKELMFTARSFRADEARDLGLVYDIHEQAELQGAALDLAARFCQASPQALGLTKRLANRAFDVDYRVMAELESAAQTLCIKSDYHKEATRRFVDKEPMPFNWDAMDRDDTDG